MGRGCAAEAEAQARQRQRGRREVVATRRPFVAHAGGPPADAYLLSQKIDKTELVGTSIYLFFVINGLKFIPYALLGLLSFENLSTSLILLPLVPIGVLLGHFLHNRVSQRLFENIAYGLLFLTGCKLLFDGLTSTLIGA